MHCVVCFLKVQTAFCHDGILLFLSYIFIILIFFKGPATTTVSDCPAVLKTPSLHRSHLNSCLLESPALTCQPSTSSAFPMDSSGVSVLNETKDSTSQHDDGNMSTTSRVSSRASAKGILGIWL